MKTTVKVVKAIASCWLEACIACGAKERIALVAFVVVLSTFAGTVRLVPCAKILVEDADVVFAPTVFYPGWIARTPAGGNTVEADGARHWRIAGDEPSSSKKSGGTRFEGTTRATVADGTL